jgi:hypothetical protein
VPSLSAYVLNAYAGEISARIFGPLFSFHTDQLGRTKVAIKKPFPNGKGFFGIIQAEACKQD